LEQVDDRHIQPAGADPRDGPGSRNLCVQAKVIEIIAAQPHTHTFGNTVADRVRMTDSLTLDDFNALF
jgi:hypothetical protein